MSLAMDAAVQALTVRGPPEGSGTASSLWKDCVNSINVALHCPFVKCLADGSLPKHAFQHYVSQDAFFLKAFAQAYALALCQTTDTQERQTLQDLLQGVDKELELHKAYAKTWGVRLAQMHTPTPATQSYVDFLLDTALHQNLPCILAAMIPCTRLYAYIGCQLRAAALAAPAVIRAQGPYASWIKEYSSDAFLTLPATKEALLDKLASAVPYGKLQQLYRAAMQMEVDFFSAQPGTSTPPSIGMLVVDFDDTCTSTDTISQIFNTAIADRQEMAPVAEQHAVGQKLRTTVDSLVSNYVSEQKKLYASLLPEGVTASASLDQTAVKSFVDRLTAFDRRMNTVVVDAQILQGIRKGHLATAGRQVGLQPGCLAVLSRAQQAGVPVHVVSVNYSAELVQAALQRQDLTMTSSEGGKSEEHHDIVVHANELVYKDNVSTGNLIRQFEGGADKSATITKLMQHIQAGHPPQSQQGVSQGAPQLAVYIGDSPSDLGPLLLADLGIVVGQNQLLRRVAQAHGVLIKPLTAAPASGKAEEGTLYEAESWSAIGAFLFGPDPAKALTPSPGTASSNGNSDIRVPRVLTVAGSDSGGGAGIQADLKTYQARGVFGTSAISALTAQNTRGVRGVHTAPAQNLADQIEAVLSDIGADVVKTGMLPTAEAVRAVADQAEKHGVSQLVVDPVLVATSGDSLAGSEVAEALKQHLFPIATVITPNLPEASVLLDGRTVDDLPSMKQAARALHKLGPKYVLIKGGHLMTHPARPPSQPPSKPLEPLTTASTPPSPGAHGHVADHATGGSTITQSSSTEAQSDVHMNVQAGSGSQTQTGHHRSGSDQQPGTPGMQHAAPGPQRLASSPRVATVSPLQEVSNPQHATSSPQQEVDGTQSDAAGDSDAPEAPASGGPAEKQESAAPAVDVLFDGQEMTVLQSKRILTYNTHGTGCTLASAIAAEMAKGYAPPAAVRNAKAWLSRALEASAPLHIGSGPHRPLNHGFEHTTWARQSSLADVQKPAVDYRLYAVTDPDCNARCKRSNVEAVQLAVQGGATLIQLREKAVDGGAFVREAQALMDLLRPTGVGLIINDRVDVALAVGAEGVHVGQDDIPARMARDLLGPNKILGVSVKTVEQAVQAAADGADYLGAGAVFPTSTKASSTITLEMLQQICQAVNIPVVAIGGITAENGSATIEAGCQGIAVVSAIFGVTQAASAAKQLRSAVDQAIDRLLSIQTSKR